MTVDALPASHLEVIQPQLFLGHAEASFDCPTPKGNSQQLAERHPAATDDLIGQEVFHLASADVASHDQSLLATGEPALALPPNEQPLDLTYLGASLGVFDSITLPRLLRELLRVRREIANFAWRALLGNIRHLGRSPTSDASLGLADNTRLVRPEPHIAWNFRDKRFAPLAQRVEKLVVSTIQFVKRPYRYFDSRTDGSVN